MSHAATSPVADQGRLKGHRLLTQSQGFDTKEGFRAWIARTFGVDKATRAVILSGFNPAGPAMKSLVNEHPINPNGFQAFLPL